MLEQLWRWWGAWHSPWGAWPELEEHYPARHSDYRDSAPEPLEAVFRLYQPVVQDARWTHGLCEMWFWKLKPVKHSVHIPCWDSFKWNPLKWRGACFGRTFEECYWTGLRQTRWARAVYAAGLGREYVMPVRDIGRHGYKSDIKALCWMYFLMGCLFGCGFGQLFTLGGNLFCNFSSWYSCHARERLRRRYHLPPTFGLPPGVDDCLVHFFCFYCASHQARRRSVDNSAGTFCTAFHELRELAVRGVDGPGMHILDVLPRAFPTAPGIEEAVAERRAVRERMLAQPPKMFVARRPKAMPKLQQKLADAALSLAEVAPSEDGSGGEEREAPMAVSLQAHPDKDEVTSTASEEQDVGRGWLHYAPPPAQAMEREVATVPASAWLAQQEGAQQEGVEEERQHGSVRFGRGSPLQNLRAKSEVAMQRPAEVSVLEEDAEGRLRVAPRAWSVAY